MTAYACEPEKGSEPGVGWGWANGLSPHVDLTVATRANNRPTIEKYYTENPDYPGGRRPTFLYYDPPDFFVQIKRKGILPTQIFFAIWKLGVMWRYRKQLCDFDLYHHLTYSSIRLPGLWWFASKPVVVGPVGGTSTVSPNYISFYGTRAWKEKVRALMIRSWKLVPWVRFSLGRAGHIVGSNSEAAHMMAQLYGDKVSQITEIGVDRKDVATQEAMPSFDRLELVWIGMVEPWKGWPIALKAVARAKAILGDEKTLRLRMLGRGRDESAAATMVSELGITDEVKLLKRIPLEELNQLIVTSHIMIFSSVKDTSGTVVLEAMCKGKPLICLNHQGVGDMTTDNTAIRIEVSSLEETVENFANAIVSLAKDEALVKRLGAASRERVLSDYVWDEKAKKMNHIYRQLRKNV